MNGENIGVKCFVCGGNADVLGAVLLDADGDFACSPACFREYKADKARFFASVGDDEAYAAWWAEGGVDVKAYGEAAWRSNQEGGE